LNDINNNDWRGYKVVDSQPSKVLIGWRQLNNQLLIFMVAPVIQMMHHGLCYSTTMTAKGLCS